MAIVGIIIGAISAVTATTLGVVGAVKQGQQQKAMYEYQAAVAARNAQIAQQNAVLAAEATAFNLDTHRRKVKKLLAAQQALIGGSGVEYSGSALDVVAATAGEAVYDEYAIARNGLLEEYNFKTQQSTLESEIDKNKMLADLASSNATFGAITTGITGALSTATVISNGINGLSKVNSMDEGFENLYVESPGTPVTSESWSGSRVEPSWGNV